MDLTLGKRADYTVRAVLDLARHHGDGRRKRRDIAEEMDVPVTYLPTLLAELVRAGLVSSVAGPDGGYALARDPAEVTLLEVVEVADGPLRSKECVLRGGPCRWEDACAVHEPWFRAQEALRGSLAATTFAELVAADALLEAADVERGRASGGAGSSDAGSSDAGSSDAGSSDAAAPGADPRR